MRGSTLCGVVTGGDSLSCYPSDVDVGSLEASGLGPLVRCPVTPSGLLGFVYTSSVCPRGTLGNCPKDEVLVPRTQMPREALGAGTR